jgi:hypothetical protein
MMGEIGGNVEEQTAELKASGQFTKLLAAFINRATGLTRGVSAPEGEERIELRRVPWNEAWALFEAERITDSMTAFALMHEALRRRRGGAD